MDSASVPVQQPLQVPHQGQEAEDPTMNSGPSLQNSNVLAVSHKPFSSSGLYNQTSRMFGSAVLARTESEKLEDQLNKSRHVFSTECPEYGETSCILPLQLQLVLASVISRILWGSTVKHSKTGQEQCNRYFNVYRNYITISCCTNM